jgi:aminoacrylate hydrolase
MPFAPLRDGAKLRYEVAGHGPPLLLVSGLGGTLEFWSGLVPRLGESRRVILHDHRGTGQSDKTIGAYSVEGMATDVLDLMDHLGIATADLVGHSTGGAIGQVLAIDHPHRLGRLVISQSWASADDYFRLLFETRMRAFEIGGAGFYTALTHLFGYPPAWIARSRAMIDAAIRNASMAADPPQILPARIKALLAFDRRTDLPRIVTPTQVIGVRDDLITPYGASVELASLIPGAQLVSFDHGGHFFPRVEPDAFIETVSAFLDSRSGGL